MHSKMHSVIFLLFWIKNDDTETGWNVRITMSIWIVSAETGSLSFVMFWSNSLYIRKPCTIFFYEKVVKWCKYLMIGHNIEWRDWDKNIFAVLI